MLVVLVGCGAPKPPTRLPDARSGYAVAGAPAASSVDAQALWAGAERVLERRCVVCHGCYDAPCQLKLDSFDGVERGASSEQVYASSRLVAAAPSRLSIDAEALAEWRARGFHSVLPDRAAPDPRRSVLLRMLELKRAHPLTDAVEIDTAFTLALDREQTCSDDDGFDDYARKHPLWGMPYALPQLEDAAHAAVVAWLRAGAPAGKPPELAPALRRVIREFEDFFNGTSRKQKLVSRYIYEHLFIGSLYFKGVDERTFFRLVRSRTPSGYAIDEIPTRRPFEDPGPGEFYYRFERRIGPALAKTHMPYALDAARLARYRELFIAPDYEVDALPGYELEVASNPFRSFVALPITSRYAFLLDDAEFTMMGFIKGPVCRGQVALNVIQERFWITFLAPDAPLMGAQAELLREAKHDLELPAEEGSDALPLAWWSLASQHERYVKRRNELLSSLAQSRRGVTLDLIWDGDGSNGNAALTVFRHFDSATVVRGLVGGPPKTAWVVDYPLFERIHYLLVAGFDVFGNVSHQLMTRLYMDFLRMEGEANLLALLPAARRRPLVDSWYQRLPEDVMERVRAELIGHDAEPRSRYESQRPELELWSALEARLGPVRSRRHTLAADATSAQLRALDGLRGKSASYMPELSFIAVSAPDGEVRYYSVMRESAHTNVAQLFDEKDRRLPDEDELCVVPGFLGAYPNALFRLKRSELAEFIEAVKRLDAAGYRALRTRFGVSRSSGAFWPTSDAMHDAYRKAEPLEAGLFDYSRLGP